MKPDARGMLLRRGAILLVCAMLLVNAAAQAAGDARRTVRVGFFAMDGYHMESPDGVRSGYGYDFMQLVARYSNLRFEYVGYEKSWDEMQEMLLRGEIDLLTSAQKTPEREERFDFSANLIGTSTGILTVKAGDNRYADGDFDGIRVGLVEGNSRNAQLDRFMTEHGFSYAPVYYEDMNAVTAALQEGKRIDAAMTSTLRWTDNEWTLAEFDPSPFYAIVRKGDRELLDQLDAAIALMDTNSPGWRTRLFNTYYSMDSGEVVAFTAEERAYLAGLKDQGRVLTAVMNPDSAPYSYFVDGKPMGIIPDIFAEAAARMGLSYTLLEPHDREEYKRLCMEGGADIILDGLSDYYTVEENGLEISDPYYSAPLAALSLRANTAEIRSLVQPAASLLNEEHYASIFREKTLDKSAGSLEEAAESIRAGRADGSYMPYYCAQWLSDGDVTGKLKCLILPQHNREYVYAVRSEEDYRLLAALNKAVGSLSNEWIVSVVTADTQYPDKGFSLVGFLYQNTPVAVGMAGLLVALVALALFFADKNRRVRKELVRSRRMERYIGYLCDMYDRLLEADLDLHTRTQYKKQDGTVVIDERTDFAGFDLSSVHPEDQEACQAAFSTAAIRRLAASEETEQYMECRMKTDGGVYRWFSVLLKLIPKDREHPCGAMLLIKDVDDLHRERERSREALVNALDAANVASRSKSTFLSSMSHEIRTPLNAMIGYMTIASASVDNREKVLHCIDQAGVAAKHLLSIINDVLDISSMESGKMKLAKEQFDLKDQLNGISSVFYQQCKQKNVQFVITVTGLTEECLVGDPMRVNQILMNLMSNAVKFTESGGCVSLLVVQTAQNDSQTFIRFIVKDTGIGMSEEYQKRLFSPFEQESAETARKYGGTGLGMSITKNLVSLMGGQVEVSSKQGEGTAFTVTLPFGRTGNESTKAVATDFSHLRALVVDDMENERDYVRALMGRCGVHCDTARSGEEAVRLVALHKNTPERYDLCIIDWNMPGLDGVETTRLIHQECDPDIPIIIATAYDISEFAEQAQAAGAAKIISKPLFQSTLFDLLVSTYGERSPVSKKKNVIPNLNGMRLLLAEDNEMNVEVALGLLEMAGITADVARDGREAVERFLEKDGNYDVILMDVQMPVMDGYAATKAIRESGNPKAATVPILAMTANAFAEDVSASLAAGMNGHLSKPIDTNELFQTLQRIQRR